MLSEFVEASLRDHGSCTVYAVVGETRIKLVSIKTTHNFEPVLHTPDRSGAHMTFHQSGIVKASDNRGFSDFSSWIAHPVAMKELLETITVDIPGDAPLIAIPHVGFHWLTGDDAGTITIDIPRLIEALASSTIDLVTRRMVEAGDPDVGPFFIDLNGEAVLWHLSDDDTWLSWPLEHSENPTLLARVPILGPVQKKWQELSARARELQSKGLIKEPKDQAARAVFDELVADYIDQTDWTRMRFRDHIRGISSRLERVDGKDMQVDEAFSDEQVAPPDRASRGG